ncbi:transcription elongation factor GreA [bacterium]|nr:transcription elongation factor GreA [bacterium]MBU1153174.1 transcription elongation factor GreA [bacterium]MBU1782048.1 transcription elongation factor GreA [bacterium]MBU2599915.1 transcription elongation factor GreA [bacterium]
MDELYLTTEGLNKLKEELNYLKNVRRGELSKAIGEARDLGDLRENAEYQSAKEEQGRTEAKIRFLEEKISRAKLVENEKFPTDTICIGSKVKLEDLDKNLEQIYTLVSPLETDFNSGKISIKSPVAKGLLGKKVSEVVEINIPAGQLHYKILDISR